MNTTKIPVHGEMLDVFVFIQVVSLENGGKLHTVRDVEIQCVTE